MLTVKQRCKKEGVTGYFTVTYISTMLPQVIHNIRIWAKNTLFDLLKSFHTFVHLTLTRVFFSNHLPDINKNFNTYAQPLA